MRTLALLLLSVTTLLAQDFRVTAPERSVQMRVQVFYSSGTPLYDSDWKSGNILDVSELPLGTYQLRISSRDLEGRVAERQTTLNVAHERITIDPALPEDLKLTTTAHDGTTGQIITTSGALSFRFGDYLNKKDTEAMRLSPEGNLEVKGWIKAGQGILFSDGSVVDTRNKLKPRTDAAGAGTMNKIPKWLETGGTGTLGDSAVSEVGGNVGIGTLTPTGKLHIFGAANADLFAGMGVDMVAGPSFNMGYGGATFGRGAGFFNVRPDASAIAPNPSLRFMTNNNERMIITAAGFVGIGTSAPPQRLSVEGNLSLPATTALVGSIFIGGNRFLHANGDQNVFVGAVTGNAMTTGFENVGIGTNALKETTTGFDNVAVGHLAMSYSNGYSNVGIGSLALLGTNGSSNTAVGYGAMANNSTGGGNVAVGNGALQTNTTGGNNIAIGSGAGIYLTTGNNNIDIGNSAGANGEANTIRIGALTYQTRAFIQGIYGVQTGVANPQAVVVDSSGQLGTTSSSIRYKCDVADMGGTTDDLMRLRPVTFRYRAYGDDGPVQYGLIAEEVAEIYPGLVTRDREGLPNSVLYQFLPPMMLNELKKQRQTIADQQRAIDTLTETVASLGRELAELKSKQ